MGTNYNKENISEKKNSSNKSEILSNLNEKKNIINNFIHSNSISKKETTTPLKIKKSNLNQNCHILNILKLSENISSNYLEKEIFSSNESLYSSLFLYKDINFNQQTNEKLVKSRLKKIKNLISIQESNLPIKKIKTKNNDQTQSVYSKNISLYGNDVNSDLNDTKSKIFNMFKNGDELNSNYNPIKQNSIIKEEKELDCLTNPLTYKSKKLNEKNKSKKKEYFYLMQQEYSNQVRNITLNKGRNSSPDTNTTNNNDNNNEIYNSNISCSPRLNSYSIQKIKSTKLTKFGDIDKNNKNNDILSLPLGGSLINYFQENLSPDYDDIKIKNENNVKKLNTDNNINKNNKNTLKNKLKNSNYKIDLKEMINSNIKNNSKTQENNININIKNDKKIQNNKINEYKINLNLKKNHKKIIKSNDFISQYEKYIGLDQSYKTNKPKIYITSYDELNKRKKLNHNEEYDYENLNNTLGNIIEEDSDYNNLSYLDIINKDQKNENKPSLKREYFINKNNKNKINLNQNYNHQISISITEPKYTIANTISSNTPRRGGSTTLTSIHYEKKKNKK